MRGSSRTKVQQSCESSQTGGLSDGAYFDLNRDQ